MPSGAPGRGRGFAELGEPPPGGRAPGEGATGGAETLGVGAEVELAAAAGASAEEAGSTAGDEVDPTGAALAESSGVGAVDAAEGGAAAAPLDSTVACVEAGDDAIAAEAEAEELPSRPPGRTRSIAPTTPTSANPAPKAT